MPYASPFSPRTNAAVPKSQNTPAVVHEDLRGLDLTSPYDAIQKNRSPYAINFRLYAEEAGDRRVTVSNRKGSGRYVDALNETVSVQDASTTGSTDVLFNNNTRLATKFIPTTTGPLTRIDLRLKQNGATGPVVVQIHADNAGVPGTKLASSGILNSVISTSPAFVQANFVEAPALTSGTTYWITVYQQDDGTGSYSWRNNTDSSNSLQSVNGGISWVSLGSSLSYKAYISSAAQIVGITRYTPENSSNVTLVAIGTTMYKVNDVTGALTSIATGLSNSATFYMFADMDGKKFWVNGYDDLKYWDGTTVGTIIKPNLPKLKLLVAKDNILFGISATEQNKLVFSEAPGNDDGAGNLWYNAWLSTSFIYVPNPKASDPVTAICAFQDNLYCWTASGKWVLYGSDPGSFDLRKSTGSKGTYHQRNLYVDDNYIYFISNDGLYQHNGSSDDSISELIQPEFDRISDKSKVFVTKWKRMIRFYYPYLGSGVNNRCILWHTLFQEMLLDTETYVSMAYPYTDGDDPTSLVEVSSTAPQLTYAEQDYNNYGKAIDFAYYCKYDAMGNPAIRKRLQKFFPLIEGESGNYRIQIGVDKDRMDTPTLTDYYVATSGAKIGQFAIGDGTLLGIPTQFKPSRIQTSGYAYYWQVRFQRKGINLRVRVIGYVLSIRSKRL